MEFEMTTLFWFLNNTDGNEAAKQKQIRKAVFFCAFNRSLLKCLEFNNIVFDFYCLTKFY